MIIIVIEFVFFRILKYFLDPLRAHRNRGLAAWTKMSLNRARHIFLPSNINPIFASKGQKRNFFSTTKKNKPTQLQM